MTKEEYQQLLQSDYWKGFSYALIKERDFTCQDCGRKFYNQRNLLNVHHLRYKDANPWSYDKHDMVVLCRECHEKRHGIYHDDAPHNHRYAPPMPERPSPPRFDTEDGMGSIDNSSVGADEISFHPSSKTTTIRRTYYSTTRATRRKRSSKKQRNMLFKLATVALVLLFVLFFSNRNQPTTDQTTRVTPEGAEVIPHPLKKAKSHSKKNVATMQTESTSSTDEELEDLTIMDEETMDVSALESNIEKSESTNHESVQELAKREGVEY